ncbi:MAG: zf-TFIIB domain-containing protein [Pseudomonadales bacterium]|nr:zf-TFIIB domain-containing protein [Pseudomonadales bacterium]
MSERKGVEIDYCPECRGVWLDRGEIDKIIERSLAEQEKLAQPQPSQPINVSVPPPAQQPYGQSHQQGYHYGHHKHYKKKSIWHEIFD